MLRQILEVFTEDYRRETAYLELKKNMRGKIRLSCGAEESIDGKIARFADAGFVSRCRIPVGEFL